jgi:hypothetical protein
VQTRRHRLDPAARAFLGLDVVASRQRQERLQAQPALAQRVVAFDLGDRGQERVDRLGVSADVVERQRERQDEVRARFRVARQLERLAQRLGGLLVTRCELDLAEFAQKRRPQLARWRLGQRAGQEHGGLLGRALRACRARRVPEPVDHPVLAARGARQQVHGDSTGRRAPFGQELGGTAMLGGQLERGGLRLDRGA